MRKNAILFILFFGLSQAFSQQNFNDSLAHARIRLTRNAMITLGSWSVANIGAGFIIGSQTQGEASYFWKMNAYWNLFNLGLAGMGYAGLRRAASMRYGFADNYKAQHAIEKLYVFNAGLDIAYIVGGLYLRARGDAESPTGHRYQLHGYGSSILLQGGFLLIMDGVMYTLHKKNTRKMDRLLEKMDIGSTGNGLGLLYQF